MLALPDRPTYCVHCDRPVTEISNINTNVFLGWAAISVHNLAKANMNVQSNSLCPAGQVERHDTGPESCQARHPGPDRDPQLNLLVQRHFA
jgi:hypothetical protein